MFAFAPLSRTVSSWPTHLFGEPGGLLDEIGLTDFQILGDDGTALTFKGTIAWLEEIELKLPALDTVSVALLSKDDFTQIPFELQVVPRFELRLTDLTASIRLRSDFLRPVTKQGGNWVPLLDAEGKPKPAEITLSGVGAVVSAEGDIDIVFPTGSPDLSLTPLDLGGSGIVLEISKVALYLSEKQVPPMGEQPGFKGIAVDSATIHLSGGLSGIGVPTSATFDKLRIGNSGFSGTVAAQWSGGAGKGQLFGMQFELKSLDLSFQHNVPTGSALKGTIKLPFFDQPLDVEIGFTPDGGLTIGIDSPGGLAHLSVPNSTNKVLDLELDSLKFNVDGGVLTATLSGKLTPTFPGLTWPAVALKDLTIDSKGNVNLPGGWLDLPEQFGLDFHGFKVNITKFGMGRNEDGTKWIGCSGAIKLVDGLPAGASVEGLRITAEPDWSRPRISFNGVGVELDAKAFYFKGAVAYREFDQVTPTGTVTVRRFDGDIKLKLRSPELTIDGNLVIGSVARTATTAPYNFFAIYVGVDLPTGISLGTTGLGLYGIAGLLAIEMEPDKKPTDAWYAISPAESWYKRPEVGVDDLKKWVNVRGSKAFGAGVTLGTYADNGYTFSGKVLLAIVFPGPIILLEGMANLLKDRAKLTSGEDPLFRALAVLDNRAGSLLIGLDVKYNYKAKDPNKGRLLKISAGTEAYYEFGNPNAWHIYLGIKEPRERRIQADILSLFSANAYLMLNARQLAMGAWVGYDRSWKFGPLSVTLQAWMESNAVVSFKPAHLYADLWVHGAVDLKAFGFGLGLTLDAKLAADVFDPFHIVGEFAVGIKLPWPLNKKKIEAHVKLEWKDPPVQPPIPAPLKDVAIEHFKTSTKWPLPMSRTPPLLVVPNYADDDGFLPASLPNPLPDPPNNFGPPQNVPIVALDCRPSLGFARNVNDDAQVGAIVQPLIPDSEWIGDPARGKGPCRVRYGLQELRLDKWDGAAWKPVAGKGGGSAALPEKIFGTWAPVDGIGAKGVGQSKLLLWSKTGFDHMRHTGTEWSEWFAGTHPTFPCLPISRTCLDFESFDSNKLFPSPLTHPKRSDVHFTAEQTGQPQSFWVSVLDNPIAGKRRALRTTWPGRITISFDNPVNNLRIAAAPGPPLAVSIDPVESPVPVLGTAGKKAELGLAPTATGIAAVPAAAATPIGPVETPGPITSVPAKPGPAAAAPTTPELITPGPVVVPPPDQMPVTVIVQDQSGRQFGPFPLVDNVIDLKVSNIKSAVLLAPGPLLPSRGGTAVPRAPGIVSVLEVCATFAPLGEARAAVRIDNIALFDPVRGAMVPFFSENFDGVTAPALPAEWTTAFDGSGRPWLTSATNPASVPNDAFAPETNDIGETQLITPIIAISFAETVLTFQSLFNLEASATAGVGLDGMVLEISINGGPFVDITDPMAGGTFFITGGYTHVISGDFDSPLGGQRAWSGLSAGKTAAPAYMTTEVQLSAVAVAGQNIQLKWRVVTDNRPGAATVPPTDTNADPAALAESIRLHNLSSSQLWSAKGSVLEPYTNYRLRIVTTTKVDENSTRGLPQLAYFQTKGPPGLSTLTKPTDPPYPADLVDPSNKTTSKGALDDLTLYVHQTVPPTVPQTGELPLLPRPVYRGYDVGVLFNEDYVDLMYRLAGRDLALLLYDRNNQPVRDRSGRLVVLGNPWGVTEKLSFNAQETPWIALLNGSPCLTPVDPKSVPRDQTLQAAHEAQILDPDTLYNARLMPLLVHEDFGRVPAGTLGRWKPREFIAPGGSSHWQIEEFGSPGAYRMVHTPSMGGDVAWLGSMLVLGNHPGLSPKDLGQPSMWSDYRLSLHLRSSDASAIAIGAAFRYADADNFYLFTMDRPKGARQLLRVKKEGTNLTAVTLAEDEFTYDVNHDYHLVVEAIGDSLRIYLEDTLLFDVTDATIKGGGVALQCSTSGGAAFSDIQVHDFSKAAKSVYHFPFTTSAFVDFFHHLHSFDDECWLESCTLPGEELANVNARSTSNQNSPIGDDEARAFERLADNILKTSANQLAARTEITRVKRTGSGDAVAFLLRTPEPIDWKRTSLTWAFGGQTVPSPLAPGPVKLVGASIGSPQPQTENITLLIREPINLTGYRVEKRKTPRGAGTGQPTPALDDPASTWISVYEFGSESIIAPGTQIVINSGNPDNPPPAVPRVLRRFRAPAGAPGDVQLAGNAADLRLVDSQGAVVHARRFLNNATSYNPVTFQVLRKADGTAFFLFPAGFPGFLQGDYQMTMTFRRDNTALDPNSLILSAAGQKTAEAVILDVPWSTL